MKQNEYFRWGARVLLLATAAAACALAQQNPALDKQKMSFFITSAGPGNGADLGGLAGADAHCTKLAQAAGSPAPKVWRAYLSTTPEAGKPAVNAKDRIGAGPWFNAYGVQVAASVDDLVNAATNNLKKTTSVTEKGETVAGRGDSPNTHDILTGTRPDGTAAPGDADSTCKNWTSHDQGSAIVGHHDRQGGGDNPTSWSSAHSSRGCSQANLVATGGTGRFYCFAQ